MLKVALLGLHVDNYGVIKMSEYSEAFQKLTNENKSKLDAAFKVATKLANSHSMHHVMGEDSEAYQLVDMLTLKGRPVSDGEDEIHLLLDSILVEALIAYENPELLELMLKGQSHQ